MHGGWFSPPGVFTPFDDGAKVHLLAWRPIRRTPHHWAAAHPYVRGHPPFGPKADNYLRLRSATPYDKAQQVADIRYIYGTEAPRGHHGICGYRSAGQAGPESTTQKHGAAIASSVGRT